MRSILVLLAFCAQISITFASFGYYFHLPESTPSHCYYDGTGDGSCADNCDYFQGAPDSYCNYLPMTSGCNPMLCNGHAPVGETVCFGCPIISQVFCPVFAAMCNCELIGQPITGDVCQTNGTLASAQIEENSSVRVHEQNVPNAVVATQSLHNVKNGSFSLGIDSLSILFNSAVYIHSQSIPVGFSVSCPSGGTEKIAYSPVTGNLAADCQFQLNTSSSVSINVEGSVTFDGSTSELSVSTPVNVSATKSSNPVFSASILPTGTFRIQPDLSTRFDAISNVQMFSSMNWNILSTHVELLFSQNSTYPAGSDVSFVDGSYLNLTWIESETVTTFSSDVLFFFSSSYQASNSFFTLPNNTVQIKPALSFACNESTRLYATGLTSVQVPSYCILSTASLNLTMALNTDSVALPNGAVIASSSSYLNANGLLLQLPDNDTTTTIPDGSTTLSIGCEITWDSSKKSTHSIGGKYLHPADLGSGSLLKSTASDVTVDPLVDFSTPSVLMGFSLWSISDNFYYTSDGCLWSTPSTIDVAAESYIGFVVANSTLLFAAIDDQMQQMATSTVSVAAVTSPVDGSYDLTFGYADLTAGSTVANLVNVDSKSTNAFEEQFSIYLNQGGVFNSSTGDIELADGSQYNMTVDSAAITLQFDGEGVTWYFNNNSVNVPAGVTVQAVDPSGNPVVFEQAVIIDSDGVVYDTNGDQLGHFDSNGNYVDPTPPVPPTPSPPLPVIPEQCKNASMNLYIVNRLSSCAAFGWTPAAVDSTNYNAVSNLIYNCGLPGSRAAIGSWEGYDFNADFITNYLVFTVGYSGGGSGDVSVATITDGIPFVCQSN